FLALESLAGLDQTYFDLNRSGARLAWEFFHPDKPVPRFISYIEDRVSANLVSIRFRNPESLRRHNIDFATKQDLWRFQLPHSREFSAFFRTVPFTYNAYKQYYDNDHLVDEAITAGIQIVAVVTSKVNTICSTATSRTFRDTSLKALVVRSSLFTSEVGAELVARDCDFGVVWVYEAVRGACRVSLRSCDTKADVSEIARRFGGGGHHNSAGFTWNAKTIEGLFE
ncbi:hypothetical protein BC937DRAFT_91974, partial [Endogone sp. FLAS-F59071]